MKIPVVAQDPIERQVMQVMRENYAQIEGDVLQSCRTKINNEFYDEFIHQAKVQKNNVDNVDLKTILTVIKDAYLNAGMNKDAIAIDSQIARLDVKA